MSMEMMSKIYEIAEEQQSIDARKSAGMSANDREEDKEIRQLQRTSWKSAASRTTGKRSRVARTKKLEAQVRADQELPGLLKQEDELLRRKIEQERKIIQNRTG